ncbi:hypothetical protein M9Y10_039345 [Tritrichomonas musculus]|uniref:Viral A-type inclusion protein n=1 Tax=Tritrichomonas musculus TaxID=1915356 RepID=A0ABR2KB08_9EUKA
MSEFSEPAPNSESFESEILPNSSGTSDISSANVIEKQFSDLQNDILEQGRAIESFIKLHSAKKSASETFRVLQTLFVLFKSALSMNINLRQIIVNSRSQLNRGIEDSQKIQKEKNEFIINAKSITRQQFNGLPDIIEFLKQNVTLKQQVDKLEDENRTLLIQTQHLKGQIIDFEAQKEIELVALRNRAETAESNSIDLKNQIKLIQSNNYQLEQTISQIEEKNAEAIEQYQKKSIEESKNSTIKLKNVHKKMIQMRKEQEQLQSSLIQAQSEKEQYRISLNQLEQEKLKLISDLENLNNRMQIENNKKGEIVDSMSKMQERLSFIEKENNQSNSIISDLKTMNKKVAKALKKTIKENHKLENENSQLISAIDDLNGEIDRLKQFLEITDIDEGRNSEFSLKDIIQAFHDLRNGLGLKKKWDPKKVTRHILRKMKELESNLEPLSSDNSNYNNFNNRDNDIKINIENPNLYRQNLANTNINDFNAPSSNFIATPLQEQIRSLQNEIDSLRNDLLTD